MITVLSHSKFYAKQTNVKNNTLCVVVPIRRKQFSIGKCRRMFNISSSLFLFRFVSSSSSSSSSSIHANQITLFRFLIKRITKTTTLHFHRDVCLIINIEWLFVKHSKPLNFERIIQPKKKNHFNFDSIHAIHLPTKTPATISTHYFFPIDCERVVLFFFLILLFLVKTWCFVYLLRFTLQIDNKGVLSQCSHRTVFLLYFDCSWTLCQLFALFYLYQSLKLSIFNHILPNFKLIKFNVHNTFLMISLVGKQKKTKMNRSRLRSKWKKTNAKLHPKQTIIYMWVYTRTLCVSLFFYTAIRQSAHVELLNNRDCEDLNTL